MTVENLEKELKQEKLHSIYLFYGEETYLLENAVKKIKKIFGDLILGINYIQINETNVNGLISDIETPAFGYDKKLIIVKNSNILKKEKKYSLKDAENKAMELAKEKVLLSLDEKDEILTEKVLQKSINDSIMNIDIFITTKENIATLS